MGVDVYQEVTDTIIRALESGTVPWRKPWRSMLDGEGHRNFHSRKQYRGINPFLLECAMDANGWDHPLWLTFKQAQAAGGKVQKGSKSTLVVFWKMLQVQDESAPEGKREVPMLRYFRVFNVAQVDGLEVPPLEVPEHGERIAAAQAIIDGYPVTIEHGGDRACYAPSVDLIKLPHFAAFKDPEHYYNVAYHEMVHSTGHASRLNREDLVASNGFGSDSYSREELTAEMGAAMLCGKVGISPATIDDSAAYIASWLRKLRNDRKMVVQAAGRAQKAADYIIGS